MLIIRPVSSDGGVGFYYDNIKSHFTCQVRYFNTGERKKNDMLLFRQIREYYYFVRELILGKYDLVHINPSLRLRAVIRDAIFLLISKLFRKKIVVFFRGWDDELEIRIKKRFSRLFGAVYFSADTIIVLAARFKNSLREMGYNKPVYLETTLVPDEIFDHAYRKYSKNGMPDKMNILFLSRIEKYKGVYEAVDAYIILKEKYPHITMTLAGNGSELKNIKDYLKHKQVHDVEMSGWIDGERKVQAYKNADIYLFPTYGEGMPNSLLEAMAYGLPVITCPVGGIKDFFQNGLMGYLIDSIEPENLAGLCEKLMIDSRKRAGIGQYNRKYAMKHFVASSVCKRLESIYESIMVTTRETPVNP